MSSLLGSVPILVVVAAVQLLLISNVSSLNLTNSYLHHKCNNTQGKYKQGSVFEKNFNILRTDLFKGNFSTGFRYDQKGDYPNTVFAMFQCRGDSYWDKCRSCITTAFSGLRRRCPGNKGAIIWYDQCFLKIFTTDTYNKIDYENDYYLSNAKNMNGNPELFNKEVSALLENLTIKATTTVGKKPSLYAAGEKKIGTKKLLYAMVQCAQDLVSNACHACLEWSFKKFPECCNGKQGGRVLGGSCNFRYEFYPFLRN